jgi:hypothetical protein
MYATDNNAFGFDHVPPLFAIGDKGPNVALTFQFLNSVIHTCEFLLQSFKFQIQAIHVQVKVQLRAQKHTDHRVFSKNIYSVSHTKKLKIVITEPVIMSNQRTGHVILALLNFAG